MSNDKDLPENVVQVTDDYDDFKFLESNRPTNKKHIESLMKSFTESPDTAKARPILVNEKLEVIDGQHRVEALKALGLPVYYIVERGLTIQDAQRLNSTQKNWTIMDFARSYALEGMQNYQLFLEWVEQYDVPLSVLIIYAEGYVRNRSTYAFREGHLSIMKNKKIVIRRLDMLTDVGELFKGWKHRSFCVAMLDVFKNDSYDHDHFLKRLRSNAWRLENFRGTKTDYLREIETIYNSRTVEGNHVRFF
jgi:hypothetical protein